MNLSFSVVGIGLLFGLFFALLPIALLVVLQVWLCRKGQRLGLILPGLSLLMSLVLVLSLGAFTGATGGASLRVYDENGHLVEQHHQEPEHRIQLTPGAVGAVAAVFLVTNIPTVVFGGIWLYYKNRRDFQEDLKKMKIEDLE